MFCCATSKTMDHILDLFYLATQLPIATITPTGDHHCRGFCHCGDISKLNIDNATEGQVSICDARTDNLSIYLLPICPCNKKPGAFVLGPYISKQHINSKFTYRPKEVLPFLISLLRNLQGINCGDKVERQTKRGFCLQIHKALNVIHENYERNITLDSIASGLGLNKSYLSTLFRRETGQTITDYVHQVRVNRSKELLLGTSSSILDISIQVGFSSHAYFCRTFKKLTGMTPSEFRQQNSLLV